MATFPATLPAPLISSYAEQRQNQVLRTEMDAGIPKVRRRFTAALTNLQVSWVLTDTQLSTLETFFVTTLLGGATAFDWTHPRTGAAVSARFVEPYAIKALRPDLFEVSAKVEVLP
jgi:hypothetical protein